ncbi:MAG: glycerol-3-phosphate acyltransferase [Malacoplasma sp.]|nr:glycerol-3-phosphate acyltransferase [Malacoplasma sp.]
MNVANFIGIIILFFTIGYLCGSILFGTFVASRKKVNIRSLGSGNVGAANITRNLGVLYGGIVTLLDLFKAWIPTLIAVVIYNCLKDAIGDATAFKNGGVIVYVAGFSAIVGHCYPVTYFYMLFKTKFDFAVAKKHSGGKGVASAAGFVLSVSPFAFLICFGLFWFICLTWKRVSLASILTTVAVSFWFLIPQIDYFYMLSFNINNSQILAINASNSAALINYNPSSLWWYILVVFLLSLLIAIIVVVRHKENIVRLIHNQERQIKLFNKKKQNNSVN